MLTYYFNIKINCKDFLEHKKKIMDIKDRGGSAVIIRETIKHYEEIKVAQHIMQVTSIRISTSEQTLTVSPPAVLQANSYEKNYAESFSTN